MNNLYLGNKTVGDEHPVFIIAEIGINHQGDVNIAHDLIRKAKESGADAIAISVGNSHLQTKKIAKIDFNKIVAIENVTNSPLVLHGGSGIPSIVRKKLARNYNIAKFNIGTELRMLFGNTVRKNILRNKKSYDRIEILKPTIKEMKKLTKKIISNIGPSI